MALAIQERFKEHVCVVEALKANYSSRDDVNRVYAVQQLEAELSELCSRREATVQAVVKGELSAFNWACLSCANLPIILLNSLKRSSTQVA